MLLGSPLSLGRLGRYSCLFVVAQPGVLGCLLPWETDIQLVSVKRRSQCLAAADTETGQSYMAVESLFKRVFFIQLLFSNIQCSL